MTMHSTSSLKDLALENLSIRGQKRKADETEQLTPKKVRTSPFDEDYFSGSDSDDSSNGQTQSHDAAPSTPRSPISAKPSPRYPSMLKTIPCPHGDCDKTFNRPARLQEHLRSHTNTRIHVCPHEGCGKDFLRGTHLKHHIKSAHTEIRDYVCNWDGCGKSFATNTRLKRHFLVHEGREKFKCQNCGQSFRKHGTLQKHVLTVHEGKAAHLCDETNGDGSLCGAGFDTAGKLKLHKGRDHGSEQYRCTICELSPSQSTGFSFATYSDLQEHNQSVHPPTCVDCGLACGSTRELKRHIRLNHPEQLETSSAPLSEPQIHICPEPECGKSFTKKGNLGIHIKAVHSPEKPFVCGAIELSSLNHVEGWDGADACGRGFTAKASLEEHVRTHHLGLEHSRKKERASRVRKPAKATLVGALTGTAYEEESRRNLPCFVHGCGFMFMRDYDRDVHLRSRHGLSDLEVHRLKVAPATQDYLDMESGGDDDVFLDGDGGPDRPMPSQDQFWLGGYERKAADEWGADEVEMRALIDGSDDDGNDDNDVMAIDPALL